MTNDQNVTLSMLDTCFTPDNSDVSSSIGLLVKKVKQENSLGSLIDSIKQKLTSKNKLDRHIAVRIVSNIVANFNSDCICFIMDITPIILNLCGDKKSSDVREASSEITFKIFEILPNEIVPVYITSCILDKKAGGLANLARPATKITALKLLSTAATKAPREIEGMMSILVPVVSHAMWDVKKSVKEQAEETLEDICGSIDNIDIKPFIPNLVDAIADPDTVPDCIYSLAGTTFVQTVTASALSITVPLLKRGFNDKKTAIRRKCAVITENMAKLVKNPADVEPFMPVLHPLLLQGIEQISDPECRARFTAAEEVLSRVGNRGKKVARKIMSIDDASKIVGQIVNTDPNVSKFISQICMSLTNISKNFIKSTWKNSFTSIKILQEDDIDKLRNSCAEFVGDESTNGTSKEYIDEDPDAEDLCNLEFSLAYGSKILLNNSRLHLKKGFKYGVMSEKSAGKTTMMRAIANGQVEGFPYEGVRTIFIENDIQGSQLQMTCTEYLRDSIGFGIKVTLEEANQKLLDGGFTQTMCDGLITQLSGGWKMKIALIRATMENADIMLMDEPTNHLDVLNVQWVVDYINSLPDVTCIIVSHDTAFLDKTVSHIIHFEDLKLHTYKGNITAFVERFPEAKSYFELGSTRLVFKFPQPALLDGVKTKGTAILQMNNVDFRYPGADKNQINNVTVKASMASRVAIVGANGAGKSTLIKLLTGEMKPTKGTVTKHPNCRFAYVAQHAFHHIEQHLEKSPNEYIRWRYEGGEDKEARAKSTAVITDEEKQIMEKPFEVSWKDAETGVVKKEKRVVEKLMSRRKVKKEYHYEVKWKGKTMDFNSWYPREDLVKRGFIKIIKALDSRLAASQQQGKPLTARNVEEHLGNVGLEPESATHSRIKDLSGGQKVKVVLAACTWCCPHIIILDEPTNYLDRDSLGALAKAIDNFEGGVVLITHNKEFADATTKVTWVVANNKCDVKGDPEWEKYAAEQAVLQEDPMAKEYFDAAGNKIDPTKRIKKIEEMSKQEIKKMKKTLKQKIKRGQELEEHEYDYCDEWNIKYVIAE